MIIDPEELDAAANYKLLIGSVIPRPIAWISTLSTTGVPNLAPISFFTVVGRKPPMVSLSMQPRSDGATPKDSFLNIRDTGQFVSNMATVPQAYEMHRSAFEFEPEIDEFEAVGLEREPSESVKPDRVKGAPIALECEVERIFAIPGDIGGIVWAKVVRFYVRDDIYLPGGRIDVSALHPVGRLAAEYTAVDNTFVPPLDERTLRASSERRMTRLDGQADAFSPIDTSGWSPSGSVLDTGAESAES